MPAIPLHRPGQNCWRVEHSSFTAMIIDCANYYSAVHAAICKARKSVFVLGWDIDSRIELLRGDDAQTCNAPTRFFDLVTWKARRNPEIQFYLNRWDYTLYQAAEREGFSLLRWRLFSPPNVHYHLDNMHPIGACHHQKVVVIDDELAFVGGMDIAIGRWDGRSHHPKNANRVDPGGTYQPHTRHLFAPHHDVMMMVAGPAARTLGTLARDRWHAATGEELPAALQDNESDAKPPSWPEMIEPCFTQISLAIARTMPPMKEQAGIYEVEKLYLDQIAQAEHFIYMENQYFTSPEIAAALNRQLHAKPDLRVLLVSCHEPQGIMERKAMWGGRVLFHDVLMRGNVADRVIMAYPASREHGTTTTIRIHSKLMVVDDRFLHVGSSNINNRSLRLDSECDLSIEGTTEIMRHQIAVLRNDMIREHIGWPVEQIEHVVAGHDRFENFLLYRSESTQHLCRIDDEKYRYQSFMKQAIRLADPAEPFFAQTSPSGSDVREKKINERRWFMLGLLVVVCLGLVLLWKVTPLSHYATPYHIAPYFLRLRSSPWIYPAVIGIYVGGTLVFFPLTILVFATALAFSPLQALPLAFGGMLCSACVGYFLGRMASLRFLRFFAGRAADKICQYTKDGGVAGVTLLRMVPIAPLGIVDFSLGMARVPFLTYLMGTMLGLMPGIVAFTFLGHSLERLWHNLNAENISFVIAGLGGWAGVVVLSHIYIKRWRQRGQAGRAA